MTPEAVIHLGYYAMYHGALAALIAAAGSAPRRHGVVIAAFGRLVKDRGEAEREAGRAFNRALDARLLVDYDVGHAGLERDARDIRAEAQSFLAVCRRLVEAGA